jgi:WD40 repeat protein
VAARKVRLTLAGHEANVTSLAFTRGGRVFVSGSANQTVRLWDVASGKELSRLPVGMGGRAVAVAPDGKLLAGGYPDGEVKLWDVAGRKVLRTLRGSEDFVAAVAFSPDGRLLASAGHDGEVRLWDVPALLEGKN